MAKPIRKIVSEVGMELKQGLQEAGMFVRKNIGKPRDMRFAIVPVQFREQQQRRKRAMKVSKKRRRR